MPTSTLRKNLTSMGEFLRNRSIIIWILVHRAQKLKRGDVGIGPYGMNYKSQFVLLLYHILGQLQRGRKNLLDIPRLYMYTIPR